MTQGSSKRRSISLRTRLTLITMAIIILMALALTATSVSNANRVLFNTAVSGDSAGESTENYGATTEIMDAEEGGATHAVTGIYDSEGPTEQASASFGRLSLWAMLGIILVGGAVTYGAVGYALKPLHTLTQHISDASEHALSVQLESKHDDEVGTLVSAFNRLMTRLEKVFEQQRGFAAAAAHELKTPLAAIKANVDVLEMDEQPTVAEYQNLAAVTKTQTNRMIHLVDDLFSISMGEAYDFTDELDLPKLLETLVEERQHAIDAKQIQISVHAQCRHQLLCNRAMVRHAVSNLLDNAVKYNVDGGSIDITALETDKGFVITIADTGIGIPEEHQPHVFEPFYRVDKSRSRKMGGAGLGLSIAHDMVERHGGRISLWSNEPKGMVFTVELPKLFRKDME
ncbi:HAMP domain-containing protein [Eubacteriales bacterium OttesenSCG-928-A19]|nr:HAMP domain-containing protein [Eubacteriales bacterium OttesenSCG-928-A19]